MDTTRNRIEIQRRKSYLFILNKMKTEKLIIERIDFLKTRQKDGIDTKNTIVALEWAKCSSEEEIREELRNTVADGWKIPFRYIRDLLWVLEDYE